MADGVELIGEYKGSGLKETPFLVKRADGQVIQLPMLLYVVAEHIDGERSYDTLSQVISDELKLGVSPDNLAYLVAEKLTPLGVTAGPAGASPEIQKADPLLALRLKKAVIPDRLVRSVTTVFLPLFFLPVLISAVVALAVMDFWLFGSHGVAQSLRDTFLDPALLLALFGVVVVTAAFHEIGHATGTRYGGAEPGAMGVGLYVVWPAFYTDITDTYRLGKWGRLRADLGGVYFNTLFILLTVGLYFLTHFEPLLLVVILLQLEILMQFMPFLRMDGYYMVSDITGVPDLFSRIGPIFKSLIPFREADPRVKELKGWVRVAVTAWVLTVVPILLFNLIMIVISAPRIFATAWSSFTAHVDQMVAAFGDGRIAAGLLGVVQSLALALPALAIVYTVGRIGRRAGRKAIEWSRGHPVRRTALVVAICALLGYLVVYTWLPNGDYVPIQRGERWTVADAVRSISHVGAGDPGIALGGKVAALAAASRSSPGSTASPGASPTPSGTPSPTVSPGPSGSATPSPSPTASPSPSISTSPSATSPAASPSSGA